MLFHGSAEVFSVTRFYLPSRSLFSDGDAWRWQGQVRRLVSAGDRVPADPQYLKKHLDAVLHWVDFRAFVVRPFHGDLRHFESKLIGEE